MLTAHVAQQLTEAGQANLETKADSRAHQEAARTTRFKSIVARLAEELLDNQLASRVSESAAKGQSTMSLSANTIMVHLQRHGFGFYLSCDWQPAWGLQPKEAIQTIFSEEGLLTTRNWPYAHLPHPVDCVFEHCEARLKELGYYTGPVPTLEHPKGCTEKRTWVKSLDISWTEDVQSTTTLIDELEASGALARTLTEGEVQNLADLLITLPGKTFLKIWQMLGDTNNIDNIVAIHKASASDGTRVSDHLYASFGR